MNILRQLFDSINPSLEDLKSQAKERLERSDQTLEVARMLDVLAISVTIVGLLFGGLYVFPYFINHFILASYFKMVLMLIFAMSVLVIYLTSVILVLRVRSDLKMVGGAGLEDFDKKHKRSIYINCLAVLLLSIASDIRTLLGNTRKDGIGFSRSYSCKCFFLPYAQSHRIN